MTVAATAAIAGNFEISPCGACCRLAGALEMRVLSPAKFMDACDVK